MSSNPPLCVDPRQQKQWSFITYHAFLRFKEGSLFDEEVV